MYEVHADYSIDISLGESRDDPYSERSKQMKATDKHTKPECKFSRIDHEDDGKKIKRNH